MTDFFDEYLPDSVRGFQFTTSVKTSTNITAVGSGAERRNRNWLNPLRTFKAPEAVRCHDQVEDLHDHWLNTSGPFLSFPFRDPLDFASRRLVKANLVPAVFRTDQTIGVGDGFTRVFRLAKAYPRGTRTYTRRITLPVVETILLGLNALPPDDSGVPGGPYDAIIERETGEVTFTPAPEAGLVVTWGGLFDVPIRFESDDSLDRIISAFEVDGWADLTFQEVRPCLAADASDGSA